MDEKNVLSIAMSMLLTLYQHKEVIDNNIAQDIIKEMLRLIKKGV